MRSDLIRFIACGLSALAAFTVLTEAQITVPFPSFTAGTTIQPDEVNQNFAKFGDALNRTGGTMTGTLTTRDLIPDGNNTRDLAATGTRYRDGWFGRNVAIGGTLGATGAATLGSTLAVTGATTLGAALDITGATTIASTSATALDVAGGAQFGTGNVGLIGADGRVAALTSTYFANLSGASLTGLLEANIADGTVFPRLAANETVTGVYTFERTTPVLVLNESDAAADNGIWRVIADSEVFNLQAINDALSVATNFFVVNRTGTTVDSIAMNATATTVSGSLGVGGGTAIASILSGTATWDPPSLAVGASTTTSVTITGIQASTPCVVGGNPEASAVTGLILSAYYAAGSSNTARVVLYNGGAFTADVPSMTVRVTCFLY